MTAFEKISINLALRVKITLCIGVLAFFIVALRLWYLQILKGDYFRSLSENNRKSTIFVPPARGLILDRFDRVVVKNRPAFNIELVPEDSPNPRETITILAEIVGVRSAELMTTLRFQKKRRSYEPKVILKDVTRDIVAKVVARRHDLPGVIVRVFPTRDYVYGDFGAHVIGYIREISQAQLDSPLYGGYQLGDFVGQFGIEGKWERDLQGKRGKQEVIVDATGIRRGELSFEDERSGRNITLTLDLDLQRVADQSLGEGRGAIVAMDPNTGEILALASAPRFNPNIFTGEVSKVEWSELLSGEARRLNNRVVQGVYPPGSVFKIFMAVAGLAEGVIRPGETVNCPGFFRVGRIFRCHKASGHGSVNLFEAMVQSCDVYFYTVGQRLGVDRIHDYATRFGLGAASGLELVEEKPGLIPSTAWKKAYFKNDPENQKWYPGETPSVAIGQGAVTVTPLQITRAVSALVNGGRLPKPHLVRKVSSDDGVFKEELGESSQMIPLNLDPKILTIVRDALIGVVNDPRGTGRRARVREDLHVVVAGKTGTAQVGSAALHTKGGKYEDHAWFVGYAPAEKPEIVVAALVENAGHGGVAAAPLVKNVLDVYFQKKLEREAAKNKIVLEQEFRARSG